ncbi:MAG: hypothetical protein A2934_01720 [Candidatus Sungbacteria bacterium RIFCSPLOWO2_01_FULL_47_10]|uniref:Sugar kinase n=1 Tax=Candidatus Sungbacteria bacterium RIFCSPLOWO2_01_FULL_47_10 TaxID=1802276 RepID=A0A1G2KZ53_9BACT|nr:MAG: hypothetical protein A2934_01720 [Candidatus Sungbacteria bacterium RIFCSPLOWO2_01_FULL_47_10]
MAARGITIGVDIGASKVFAARIDNGRITAQSRIFFAGHGKERVLQCIFSAIENVRVGRPVSRIGAGVPCVVKDRKILRCFNIPVLEGIRLDKILAKKYRARVSFMNDTNAMLAHELRTRPKLRHKRVLFIAWGTGIGGALAINGRLQEGAHGLCGEIGHSILCKEQMLSFEDYAAGRAICPGKKTLWVSDMIKQKNSRKAKQLFLEAGNALGAAILNVAYLFDPDVVIVGGGLHPLLPHILPHLRSVLSKHGLTKDISKIPIIRSHAASEAGVLGTVLF